MRALWRVNLLLVLNRSLLNKEYNLCRPWLQPFLCVVSILFSYRRLHRDILHRTGPCGTSAFISLGVDISPSTETLNFLCERNELISLIRLVEHSIVELAILYSHRLRALLRVMHLFVFEIRLNAILHIGSLISFHRFLNLFLCFSNLSKPRISLFNSESLILLVDSLYAEAMETVNSNTVLSASTPELIYFLGDIKLETSF
jgi:hypothetical protein